MQNIEFFNKTDNVKINKIISALIYFYKDIFGNKLLSIYIIGSYANKTNIYNSDIDLTMVIDNAPKELIVHAEEFIENLNYISNIGLDVSFYNIDVLEKGNKAISILIKEGGVHIFGKDIRDKINLPPINEYLKTSINRTLYFLSRVRPTFDNILDIKDIYDDKSFKLSFPDSTKEFFGYTERTIENSEGIEIPITKEIVLINSLIGTSILAANKVYVGDKDSSILKYREVINDEWSAHIENSYNFCREKYGYLIPEDKIEREILKEICKKTLEFENYFLDFVLNCKFE